MSKRLRAVLGTFALFAFDPRRYVLALVVVVHAEAGAVLGLPEALAGWAVISALSHSTCALRLAPHGCARRPTGKAAASPK